jgi:hypothetical protein
MDASTDEGVRKLLNDLPLLIGQLDLSSMLFPLSVLGKYQRPCLPVAGDFDAIISSFDQTHFPWLSKGINSTRTFRNDARLITIEKNPQPVGPRVSGDVPVAEVHPEQIRVGPALVLVEGFEPPLSRF